jgi:hypothetical protein
VEQAKEYFKSLSLDFMLGEIESETKRTLQEFGLPTDNPIRLLQERSTPEALAWIRESDPDYVDEKLGDPSWPEEITAAAEALFRLHLIRENISENNTADAVYNCLYLHHALCNSQLLRLETLVWLGLEKQKAARAGAARSAAVRKELAMETASRIVDAAKALRKSGIAETDIAGILCRRNFELSERRIRQILADTRNDWSILDQ